MFVFPSLQLLSACNNSTAKQIFMKFGIGDAGVEVLTAVTMKSMVFWVATHCSLDRAQGFRGTYRLHFRGERVSQARKQQR
jgi:hypothetical protein